MSLARISNATSALVAPAAATKGSGIMISRASMARNVSAWPRLLYDALEPAVGAHRVEAREPQPEPQGCAARPHALEHVEPALRISQSDERQRHQRPLQRARVAGVERLEQPLDAPLRRPD